MKRVLVALVMALGLVSMVSMSVGCSSGSSTSKPPSK